MLQVETFKDTFGPTSRRKRPAVTTSSLAEMLFSAKEREDDYKAEKDLDLHKFDV